MGGSAPEDALDARLQDGAGGARPRAQDLWRWCGLLPFIGAVPMCVVMYHRRQWRWFVAGAVLTVGWFVVPAIAGAGGASSNARATPTGVAVLVAWVVQIILAFTAPRGGSTAPLVGIVADGGPTRVRWLWWSVLPGGLGSWMPILAGVRARV
jgi:hypothetical protein